MGAVGQVQRGPDGFRPRRRQLHVHPVHRDQRRRAHLRARLHQPAERGPVRRRQEHLVDASRLEAPAQGLGLEAGQPLHPPPTPAPDRLRFVLSGAQNQRQRLAFGPEGPRPLEQLGGGEEQRRHREEQPDQRPVEVHLGGHEDEGQHQRPPGLRPQQRPQQLDERAGQRAHAVQVEALGDERPGGQEYEQEVDVLLGGHDRLQPREQVGQGRSQPVGEQERQQQHGHVLEEDRPLEGLVAGHGRPGAGSAGGFFT